MYTGSRLQSPNSRDQQNSVQRPHSGRHRHSRLCHSQFRESGCTKYHEISARRSRLPQLALHNEHYPPRGCICLRNCRIAATNKVTRSQPPQPRYNFRGKNRTYLQAAMTADLKRTEELVLRKSLIVCLLIGVLLVRHRCCNCSRGGSCFVRNSGFDQYRGKNDRNRYE